MAASSAYSTEPATRGKVELILSTKKEVIIELFPDQAPHAVRNFVQLCIDGAYDGTAFHRVIPGVMVQGGDTTGMGGESATGIPLSDEFHSRLNFTRRGLVAMANEEGKPNSAQSQFFFTLAATPWLNKQHTIFGTIELRTYFNAAKLAEGLVKDEKPQYVHTIVSTRIVEQPFEGEEIMKRPGWRPITKPSTTKPLRDVDAGVVELSTKKLQNVKTNQALLSFANNNDETEEEEIAFTIKPRMPTEKRRKMEHEGEKGEGGGINVEGEEDLHRPVSSSSPMTTTTTTSLNQNSKSHDKKQTDATPIESAHPSGAVASIIKNPTPSQRETAMLDRLAKFAAKFNNKQDG